MDKFNKTNKEHENNNFRLEIIKKRIDKDKISEILKTLLGKFKVLLKKCFLFDRNTLLLFMFVFLSMAMFLSIICPKELNAAPIIQGTLTDTENMDEGFEKGKANIHNLMLQKFPYYEQILKIYFGSQLAINENLYKNANDNDLILLDKKNGVYTDKYKSHLIRKYDIKDDEKELKNRIKLFNDTYRKVKKENQNVNMYIYAVSGIWTSEAILNFDVDIKEPMKDVDTFRNSINPDIKFDCLKIIDYTTFKKYFFKTDHHMTMQGAYQVYEDVVKLLGGTPSEELVSPEFFKIEGVKFQGSNARICAFDSLADDMYDIKFDEKYELTINGKESTEQDLNKKDQYLKGKFSDEEFYNHYGKYFHSDLGEIVFTFNKNKNKHRNILIIGDSYSNCIDKLIASHYYKTYTIDLRKYQTENDEKFVLNDYIEENDITDVVFLYSANAIYYESSEIILE